MALPSASSCHAYDVAHIREFKVGGYSGFSNFYKSDLLFDERRLQKLQEHYEDVVMMISTSCSTGSQKPVTPGVLRNPSIGS